MKHYLSTTERQRIDDFIVILEDFVEANLTLSLTMLAASSATGNTDSGGLHVGAHHVGGHHAGGGGGGC